MTLSTPQLCFLRSLIRRDMEASLLDILLRRCDASRSDWDALETEGIVEEHQGRVRMTETGVQVYKKAKVGRYF